jgi:DNA-binding PadR family transcriptional regulator
MRANRNDDLMARTIKTFSDILILKYLKTNPLSSGYEILVRFHEKFEINFSPGTIYHALYLLERKKAIKSEGDERSRMYSLTNEGEKTLSDIFLSRDQIHQLVDTIFSEN